MDDFVKHKDISFLIFSIEDEDFAINVKHVIEVVRVESLTKVPKTEQYLEGILNFRGRIVSVVNANQKLNIEN
ncbi:MAG: chemotaxis protein CheW, partial [Bacteroidales bacterium]|nr:chemotaxis protein CheW [Bacteroidales bacterium]